MVLPTDERRIQVCRIWSVFRAAKSAHGVDDQADHQNQANPAAAKNRAAKVKSATTEQEQQNHNEQQHIHAGKLTNCCVAAMGSSPHDRFQIFLKIILAAAGGTIAVISTDSRRAWICGQAKTNLQNTCPNSISRRNIVINPKSSATDFAR